MGSSQGPLLLEALHSPGLGKVLKVQVLTHATDQQAIDTLLRLAEEYTGHSKNIAAQSQGAVKGAHSQDSLTTAEADLRVRCDLELSEKGHISQMLTDFKTLLERFANSTSFDDLFDSINQIYTDADRDPELKNFFKNADRFIRRCLQEQGYILQDESNEVGPFQHFASLQRDTDLRAGMEPPLRSR